MDNVVSKPNLKVFLPLVYLIILFKLSIHTNEPKRK